MKKNVVVVKIFAFLFIILSVFVIVKAAGIKLNFADALGFDSHAGESAGQSLSRDIVMTDSAEESLSGAALTDGRVKKCKVCIVGDSAVIAIRCDAVYFHSENKSIMENIKERAKALGFREVYVTKDADIFLKISGIEAAKKNMSGNDYIAAKEKILNTVKTR